MADIPMIRAGFEPEITHMLVPSSSTMLRAMYDLSAYGIFTKQYLIAMCVFYNITMIIRNYCSDILLSAAVSLVHTIPS